MVMNKKGQNITLGTIILIVLGVAVLVFLIFGFSTGWNNLWNRITAYGGGSANVDTIKQACVLACSTNAENAYCIEKKIIRRSKTDTEEGSCGTFGLDSCPGIDCTKVTGYSAKVAEWNAANAGRAATTTTTTKDATSAESAAWQKKCIDQAKLDKVTATGTTSCPENKRVISETIVRSGRITYCCKK
jgi:hypothetical protein